MARTDGPAPSLFKRILNDPLRLVSLSFLGNILIGTLLLGLPGMTTREIPWLDLAFTSTSAVCVTGLAVFDISKDLTPLGQGTLCLLIQSGGLGIITLWLFFLSALRPIAGGVYHLASSTIGERSVKRIASLLFSVAAGTLAIEFLGAAILFVSVQGTMPIGQALGWSIFHAVSAFCNAGFALHPDNLMSYADHWSVSGAIMALIVCGGIGYPVIAEIASRPKRLSLHSGMVIVTTVLLIVGGAALIAPLEWGGAAMDGASPAGKVLRLFFLSVTPRTAGFNTIDTGALRDSSLVLILMLMLVGASPAGTGGGFKTTPLALIWLRFRSIVSGMTNVRCGRWEIPERIIFQAVWITIIYLALACVLSVALLVTDGEMPVRMNAHGALGIIFELVSALGTVGLSTGVTPHLSVAGKLIVMLAMFAGRIGPLTFAYAVGGKPRTSAVKYVEGEVSLG